jgi:hypothetical protein
VVNKHYLKEKNGLSKRLISIKVFILRPEENVIMENKFGITEDRH